MSMQGSGRLADKIALITGAAGNLGGRIARAYVAEGATVIMTGRTHDRIESARAALLKETGAPADRVQIAVLDGGQPDSVRQAMAEIAAQFGRIDILVNNAGSAGPKQPVDRIPFSAEEMEANGDTETVGDAMRNILAVTWNLARAAAPLMPVGSAMVNISTIFSHTRYFGRSPYCAPKAALNALSQQLAEELGPRGVRVNTVFPGPIESERIRTVFYAMDQLQGLRDGETADDFMGRMSLERAVSGWPKGKTLPTPDDVAKTCLYLGSDDAAALNGVEIDVAHGLAAERDAASTFVSRPMMRALDGAGMSVLIMAGEYWEDALEIARVQIACGARVLLGLVRQADVAQAEARTRAQGMTQDLAIMRFNRAEPAGMEAALADYTAQHGAINGAIICPVKPKRHFTGGLLAAEDETIAEFIDVELVGALAAARTLARYWNAADGLLQAPRVLYITNASDGEGDRFSRIHAAAVTQLIRIWRDEARVIAKQTGAEHAIWGNQIIRHTNAEEENTPFAAGHAARAVFGQQKIADIDLRLPQKIGEQTGARRAMPGAGENIMGLHLGKVAFITGGSAGIGGQVARLLALAGAKVMIAARRESELEAARERIVGELQDVGFAGVERRVKYIADVDVSNFASLKAAFDETVRVFGRIDYLINNAGVAGAEDMVVDMDLDAWRFTLDANLISNYLLIHHAAPLMRAQGGGYVLNVSSYFGGEKQLAVAYPNRADYAVSKAGQRAMVESFSAYLGPEIQCNAIAPGPVDGDRLSGTGGKPGLFARRARLIIENKRLNAVYAAVIEALRDGAEVDKVLGRLARNHIGSLSHDAAAPIQLKTLALQLARDGDGICTWDQYLLTPALAARLLMRLRRGGYLLALPEWRDRKAEEDAEWLALAPPDDQPFLPQAAIRAEAEKVRKGVLSQLHLGAMPTESEVAQATVFYLADRAVSGETFMPSGGLRVERSTIEREMFGSPRAERLEKLRGKTVWMIGEHMADYIATTAQYLIDRCGVAQIAILTRTKQGGQAIRDMAGAAVDTIQLFTAADSIEAAMDTALGAFGRPTAVISMPFEAIPNHLFGTEDPLTPEQFRRLVEENLTHHFRVARKASLYDGCQLALVSPDVPYGTKGPAFMIANFIKSTLHAFTATLAVENERLVHDVPTNQINLTRRVRSEEPRDEAEHHEELRRFTRAVLLVGAPLADAQESRYRARIYRGASMTV